MEAAEKPISLEELPPVLTAEEVAAVLRLPCSTVYQLSAAGKLPCMKIGRRWRCSKAALLKYLGAEPEISDKEPKPRVRHFVLVRREG